MKNTKRANGSTPTALADLIQDPENRRLHPERNLDMLVASLESVGAARSIVIDESNSILAGNGVTTAAARAGLTKVRIIDAARDELVAVRRRDLSPEEKRLLAIYDNRTAELAEWNLEQLQLDQAAGLDLQPWWTDGELKHLFASAYQTDRKDPDDMPAERPTDIQVGDVFQLGAHRVICGDCGDAETVAKLCGEDRPALAFTSPPYAEQRKKDYGGTKADKYVAWFLPLVATWRPFILPRGHFVLNIKPHAEGLSRQLYVFDLVTALVRDAGWIFVDEFTWLRIGLPGRYPYRFKNAFEPLYWFANSDAFGFYPTAVQHPSTGVPRALGKGKAGDTNAAKRQGKGGGAIQGNTVAPGMAYPSNVLDFREAAPAIGHPAAFPVRLPSFFIACLTETDDAVIDPFVGSGTLIIACETLKRRGLGIDLAPRYVQLTIDRWEQFTGLKATKLGEVVHTRKRPTKRKQVSHAAHASRTRAAAAAPRAARD